jgi:hypothetical protein
LAVIVLFETATLAAGINKHRRLCGNLGGDSD